MAKPDITPENFRDAAVRAAVKLGRLTELKVAERGGSVVWTLKAELDPELHRRGDDQASSGEPVAPSAPTSTPAAEPVEAEPRSAASERLIDKQALARRLNVGLRTLESMISGGKVPAAIRLAGRLVRWREDEIDAWVRAGCPDRAGWQAMSQGVDRRESRRPPKGRC